MKLLFNHNYKADNSLAISRTNTKCANIITHNFVGSILENKKKSDVSFVSFEIFPFSNANEKIYKNPKTILEKSSFKPYKEISWHDVNIGIISIEYLNEPVTELQSLQSRINLGLLLSIIQKSVIPFSLNKFQSSPSLIGYASYSSFLISTKIENNFQIIPDEWLILIQLDHQSLLHLAIKKDMERYEEILKNLSKGA
jgi:hypothetical protein